MERRLTLFILWAAFANVKLALDINKENMKTIKGKFCGSHLADMLSLVCDGVYNSDRYKKNFFLSKFRSYDDYEETPIEYLDDHQLPFPFRSREKAKTIISDFGKRTQNVRDQVLRTNGVVEECCHQACSLFEMSGYCGN